MSYDLGVWEGQRPRNDEAAGSTFPELCERYLEVDEPAKPTPAIAAYVKALVARYPDDGDDLGVWASTPVIGDASGPFVYLGISHSAGDEAAEFAAALAEEHDLVCYDPQAEMLRP